MCEVIAMGGKNCAWIRGKTFTVYLITGYEEGCGWQLQLFVNTKTGRTATKSDRPSSVLHDQKKTRVRHTDRQWFLRNCGWDFMKDKEVDHNWNSKMMWCHIVSPMENANRREVPFSGKSFVEFEAWLEELYPGKRR